MRLNWRFLRPIGYCGCVVVALTACGTDVADNGADSVPSPPPNEWGLDEAAIAEIGVVSGQAEYELFAVTSAQFGVDGEVVVANGGSSELLFYDSLGVFLRQVGGSGQAPGEFQIPRLIPDWSSDSLLVFDRGLQRVSVLSPRGAFARSFQIEPPVAEGMAIRGDILGRSRAGRFVERASSSLVPDEPGEYRPSVFIYALSPEGDREYQLASFPGDQILYTMYSGAPVFSRLPFLEKLLVSVTPFALVVVPGSQYELRTLAMVDGLTRVVEQPYADDGLTASAYLEWVEDQVAEVPAGPAREETRLFYEGLYEPWPTPAIRDLLVGSDGEVWLQVGDPDAEVWHVYNSELRRIGTLRLPSDTSLLSVSKGRVILLGRLLGGVEHLQVRALVRSPN